MGKAVANADMVLTLDPPTVTGEITIVTQPSQTEKVGGSGVYAGPIAFTVANMKSLDCGSVSPGTGVGVINPTATSMKAGGMFVIREGDESSQLASIGATKPNDGPPPPPAMSCTISYKVKVSFAGQVAVTAD